jgi:hypothetical protein
MNAAVVRWLLVPASVMLFLVAAKAHGRQIRLERELAGYHSVRFGARNPPFVEALWRRDRVRYWLVAGVASVLAIVYAIVASRRGWLLPRIGGGRGLAYFWLAVVAPMVLAFTVAGLSSLRRSVAAGSHDAAFAAALRASALWWGLVLASASVVSLLAFRSPR